MTFPFMTVALCTHNHLDRLQVTLNALQSIHGSGVAWELLVVDNASSDGTASYLKQLPAVWRGSSLRVVSEPQLGIAHARNRALAEAKGEYILFIDDDETPDPNWLQAHTEAIRAFQPDALGGRIMVSLTDGGAPGWLKPELAGFLGALDHGSVGAWLTRSETPVFTGNAAFRRAVFDRIGLFDTKFGRRGTANFGGEDVDMYERLIAHGCSVRWVPDALIHHRISSLKLRRSYFLDLHFKQGRLEGTRKRAARSRLPPRYLMPQLMRAFLAAAKQRLRQGSDSSLRLEMNIAYFVGYIVGWVRD